MVEHSYWEEKVVSSVHMVRRFPGLHSEIVEDSFFLGYDPASCPRRRESSCSLVDDKTVTCLMMSVHTIEVLSTKF